MILNSTQPNFQVPKDILHIQSLTQGVMAGSSSKGQEECEKWLIKPLAFATKFQICTKVIIAPYAYYSSCWVLSNAGHQRLEKTLENLLWANGVGAKRFHNNLSLYCTPRH